MDYPGQNGELNDEMIFDNRSRDRDAHLSLNITVKSVDITANFAGNFVIKADKGLIVKDSRFTMEAGKLTIETGAWMALNHLGTTATWSGGELSTGGGTNAKIYVHSDTTFLIKADATKLGATLVIGESQTGAPSPGTVNIAKADGTANLADHLTLSKDAKILVKTQGVLNLNQTANSSTKGGVVAAQGSSSAIDNRGKIYRTSVDADGEFLKLGVKVTNAAAGSEFVLEKNTKIDFAGEFDLNAGQYEKKAGSDDKGKINRNGGKIVFKDGGDTGRYHVYFSGELSGGSGDIQFVQTTPGAFGTVHISGNFTLGTDVAVALNVDGSTNETCDSFEVAGLTTISDAILTVNTVTSSPSPGNLYTFLTSTSGISGSGWLGLSWTGFPADYIFDPGTLNRLRAV